MKKSIFVLLVVLLSAAGLLSQEEKEKVKPVYKIQVTATRAKKAVQEIGSSVTVISTNEIQKSGKTNVAELLREVPGLSVAQNGGPGQTSSLMIRGANSEHTLVMIDGVEVNDPMSPSRSYNLTHLNLVNVERIEIVRGPQSTMYGSDALGGVIHIITRKGETKKPLLSLSALGGSHGTLNGTAGISAGTDKYDYSIEFSHFLTEGISASAEKYGNTEKDGYTNSTISGRFGYTVSDTLKLGIISRYTYGKGDSDNGGGVGMDDPNHTFTSSALLLAGNAKLSLLEGKWNLGMKVSNSLQENEFNNPFDDNHPLDSSISTYQSSVFKVDVQNDLYMSRNHTIVFGFEYDKEQGESSYRWQSAWGPGEDLFPEKSNASTGLYLQNSFKFLKGLYGNFGVRFDSNKTFGGYLTYHLSGIYHVDLTDTAVKFSMGTGFKAPSLYQMFAPGSLWGPVGNENLEAEESKAREIGIRQKLFDQKIVVGITWFGNRFNQLIDFVFGSGYVNILRAKTKGMEMDLEVFANPQIYVSGNYTYTESEDEATGDPLLRRPKHKLFLGLNVRPVKNLKIALNLNYKGKQMDVFPYPKVVEAPAYTLIDLSFIYDISKSFHLFLNIDNLFDQDYEPVMGYGAYGISAYTGLRANF